MNDSPFVFDGPGPSIVRPSSSPVDFKEWPEERLLRELNEAWLKCDDRMQRTEIEETIRGLERVLENKAKALEGYVPNTRT
mgnify:CR=1 FL=1